MYEIGPCRLANVAQLLKLAVEQDDVSDHEIAGVRQHQRSQAPSFVQIVGDGLFQEHRLSAFEQHLRHRHM